LEGFSGDHHVAVWIAPWRSCTPDDHSNPSLHKLASLQFAAASMVQLAKMWLIVGQPYVTI
jgi:hypothetical protein